MTARASDEGATVEHSAVHGSQDSVVRNHRVDPFRQAIAYARPHTRRLVGAFLTILIIGGCSLGQPWMMSRLFETAFSREQPARLTVYGAGFFALLAAMSLSSVTFNWLLARSAGGIVLAVRQDLCAKLLKAPFKGVEHQSVGVLATRFAEAEAFSELVNAGLSGAYSLLSTLGGVVLMILISARLTVVMLLVAPVLIAAGHLQGRHVARGWSRFQRELAKANGAFGEVLANIDTVQAFVREKQELRRVGEALAGTQKLYVRAFLSTAIGANLMRGSLFATVGAVFWYGSHLVLEGALSIGTLAAFGIYTMQVVGSAGDIISSHKQVSESLGKLGPLLESLALEPTLVDEGDQGFRAPVSGEVEFRDVSVRYPGRDRPVLDRVDLKVSAGQVIGIVGPSGAGKSTLIKLIARFVDVSSGAVLIDGCDIRRVCVEELRRVIGIVPQDVGMFTGTVRYNVAYGKEDATEEEITRACSIALCHDFIVKLPSGYDTMLGEGGLGLSVGQRQRIAIARAILKEPAILILDEATSSLDPASEAVVQMALERAMKGRTVFIVAHRLATIERAHRIVVIEEGRVLTVGPHEELVETKGTYRNLYQQNLRDAETGAWNRQRARDELKRCFGLAKRYGRPFTVVLAELDPSLAGTTPRVFDELVQTFAEKVTEGLRSVDLFARYSKHELLVVLPETTAAQGVVVEQRLRRLAECTTTRLMGQCQGARATIAIRIGAASFTGPEEEPWEIVDCARERANERLHSALDSSDGQVKGEPGGFA